MEEKIKLLEQEIESLRSEIKELKERKAATPKFDMSSFMNLFGSAMSTKNSKVAPRTARNTNNKSFDREKFDALLTKLRERKAATATTPTETVATEETAEAVEFEEVK